MNWGGLLRPHRRLQYNPDKNDYRDDNEKGIVAILANIQLRPGPMDLDVLVGLRPNVTDTSCHDLAPV